MIKSIIACVCAIGLMTAPVEAAQYNSNSALGSELGLPISEWTDEAAPSKGIVLALHSLMFSGPSYQQFATHLAGLGYHVYAPDIRGFGKWRQAEKVGKPQRADYRGQKGDLIRIVKELKEENPDKPIILLGESIGGDYVLWLLSQPVAEDVDAAIVCAPGFRFTFHWNRHVFIDAPMGFFLPRKQINFRPYLATYLKKNGELSDSWPSDPTVTKTFSLSELVRCRAMSREAFRGVERIPGDMPLLVLAGKNDQVFNTAVIKKRVKDFGTHNLSVELVPNAGHLLFESQKVDPKTEKIVENWLTKQLTAREAITKANTANSNPILMESHN